MHGSDNHSDYLLAKYSHHSKQGEKLKVTRQETLLTIQMCTWVKKHNEHIIANFKLHITITQA
jgi:hypothetical protein